MAAILRTTLLWQEHVTALRGEPIASTIDGVSRWAERLWNMADSPAGALGVSLAVHAEHWVDLHGVSIWRFVITDGATGQALTALPLFFDDLRADLAPLECLCSLMEYALHHGSPHGPPMGAVYADWSRLSEWVHATDYARMS